MADKSKKQSNVEDFGLVAFNAALSYRSVRRNPAKVIRRQRNSALFGACFAGLLLSAAPTIARSDDEATAFIGRRLSLSLLGPGYAVGLGVHLTTRALIGSRAAVTPRRALAVAAVQAAGSTAGLLYRRKLSAAIAAEVETAQAVNVA